MISFGINQAFEELAPDVGESTGEWEGDNKKEQAVYQSLCSQELQQTLVSAVCKGCIKPPGDIPKRKELGGF